MPPVSPVLLAEPHPSLRRRVAHYAEFDFDAGAGMDNRLSATLWPIVALLWSGTIELSEMRHGPVRFGEAMAAGVVPRWRDHRYTGRLRALAINFRGGGAEALIGVRCGPLVDWAEPLERVASAVALPAIRSWRSEVAAAESFEARVAATDRFLSERATHAPPPDEVDEAAARIEGAHGMLRVSGLGTACGVNERTFRRRFVERIGVAPKLYARLARFRGAHTFLTGDPCATWAEAVVRFGYADQAHLTREFRELSGAPPTRYLDAIRTVDPGAFA